VNTSTFPAKRGISLATIVIAALALVGCAPATPEPVTPTATDVWVKAVPELMDGMAMTGVFMTLQNPSGEDVTLVAAQNTTEGLTDAPLEVHEVVKNDAGDMVMQEAKGGIVIPAKGSVTLKPGGYHVMYWDLLKPIPVGSTITLTLEFSNGTTLAVEAIAREIANANETYDPEADAEGSMDMGH
jgi:copper(I)-binding protein